tara:strand:+ start:2431 stop:2649 length:219 start_codon:yes stop_codon:yes gene_type:complete
MKWATKEESGHGVCMVMTESSPADVAETMLDFIERQVRTTGVDLEFQDVERVPPLPGRVAGIRFTVSVNGKT